LCISKQAADQWQTREAKIEGRRHQNQHFFVDAAFSPSTGAAAVGVVARDCLGYPVAAASLPIVDCTSAEEAEARPSSQA
jgi:hypothetical protein